MVRFKETLEIPGEPTEHDRTEDDEAPEIADEIFASTDLPRGTRFYGGVESRDLPDSCQLPTVFC